MFLVFRSFLKIRFLTFLRGEEKSMKKKEGDSSKLTSQSRNQQKPKQLFKKTENAQKIHVIVYGTIVWNTLASSHLDPKNNVTRYVLTVRLELKTHFSTNRNWPLKLNKLFWYVTEHRLTDIHAVSSSSSPGFTFI